MKDEKTPNVLFHGSTFQHLYLCAKVVTEKNFRAIGTYFTEFNLRSDPTEAIEDAMIRLRDEKYSKDTPSILILDLDKNITEPYRIRDSHWTVKELYVNSFFIHFPCDYTWDFNWLNEEISETVEEMLGDWANDLDGFVKYEFLKYEKDKLRNRNVKLLEIDYTLPAFYQGVKYLSIPD